MTCMWFSVSFLKPIEKQKKRSFTNIYLEKYYFQLLPHFLEYKYRYFCLMNTKDQVIIYIIRSCMCSPGLVRTSQTPYTFDCKVHTKLPASICIMY